MVLGHDRRSRLAAAIIDKDRSTWCIGVRGRRAGQKNWEGADLRKRSWDVILRKIAGFYLDAFVSLYLFYALVDIMLYLI